jgi:hypothetical protein
VTSAFDVSELTFDRQVINSADPAKASDQFGLTAEQIENSGG